MCQKDNNPTIEQKTVYSQQLVFTNDYTKPIKLEMGKFKVKYNTQTRQSRK